MIARKQMPMNVPKAPHTLDGLSKRDRARRFAVVNVAGNENVPNTVSLCQHTQILDGGQTRLA
jgi:hypothetical protein